MREVAGGVFWMGQNGQPEEAPRHQVAVRTFCMDATEVTVSAYEGLVAQGRVTPSRKGAFCNTGRAEQAEHPVNCVDWRQAKAYCASGGRRLPTEREWEYAARGGAEQREYAWGSEPPDGRCCYNHPGTCQVRSFPATAFGLHDLTGNVWEWTETPFGPYPYEAAEGATRVYRGGSFSRRFPKWMRNSLRNRFRPEEWGAHLGFRCAVDLASATCPAGSHAEGALCLPEGVAAPPPASARPAAGATPGAAPEARSTVEAAAVTTTRDPRYDSDCARYKPGRPVAYGVRGGSFAERQRAKGSCVNRDVGVGFNSVCCAQ
jgi:hypothetical protein